MKTWSLWHVWDETIGRAIGLSCKLSGIIIDSAAEMAAPFTAYTKVVKILIEDTFSAPGTWLTGCDCGCDQLADAEAEIDAWEPESNLDDNSPESLGDKLARIAEEIEASEIWDYDPSTGLEASPVDCSPAVSGEPPPSSPPAGEHPDAFWDDRDGGRCVYCGKTKEYVFATGACVGLLCPHKYFAAAGHPITCCSMCGQRYITRHTHKQWTCPTCLETSEDVYNPDDDGPDLLKIWG